MPQLMRLRISLMFVINSKCKILQTEIVTSTVTVNVTTNVIVIEIEMYLQ